MGMRPLLRSRLVSRGQPVLAAALMPWVLASPSPSPSPSPPPPQAAGAKAKAPPHGYRLHRTIPLPGGEDWGYLAADPEARRLYVPRGDRLVVVDEATEKAVGEIAGSGIRDVALARELKRGFASNGVTDTVTIFGLEKLDVLGTVPVGQGPDAVLYDPFTRRVFAFGAGSASATAIDAADGSVAGTVDLGGRPRRAASDGKGTIFVAIEDTSEVVAFGSRDLAVRARWPLAPCEAPVGLAVDRTQKRLFVGCRSQVMAVLDTQSGSVLATVPIGKGVDSVAFDDARRLAFASNEDGTLTVVGEDTPGHFVAFENVPTLPGARGLVLDAKAHRIYLPAAQFGRAPAATPDKPRGRGPIVPGTFVILVLGR
jgi:DNA-binding beta-propeller fold protein YncE